MSSTEPNTNFDPSPFLSSLPQGGVALVIGASGGIGSAFMGHLQENKQFSHVLGLSRSSHTALDLSSEATIAAAADTIRQSGQVPRLIILATGMLHEGVIQPEKGWRDLDPDAMARSFAVNTIGPALVMKHFLPLLPREGKSVFAALSAKVGSIGDNRLGGWHSYRASKAALNQIIHTLAIELARTHPKALCVALHPGTVETALSEPFSPAGRPRLSPKASAEALLKVLAGLEAKDSGGFFGWDGQAIPF